MFTDTIDLQSCKGNQSDVTDENICAFTRQNKGPFDIDIGSFFLSFN